MFETSMMLAALSGEEDKNFPHGMAAYRKEALENPEKWKWSIEEAKRRKADR
jgi:hypothetical protein